MTEKPTETITLKAICAELKLILISLVRGFELRLGTPKAFRT